MSDASDDRDLPARNAARSLLFLYFATCAVGALGWYVTAITPGFWHWYVALLVSGGFALFLSIRPKVPIVVSNTLFLLGTAVTMITISLQTYNVAAFGRWSPIAFAGYKLIAVAVAIVAPIPTWSAYLVIGSCAVVPTLQTIVASPEVRLNYTYAEPWVSIVYALLSFLVLRHRVQAMALARKMTSLETERRAIDHLARIFLGLRDLTNTPFQSIELTAWMLRQGHLTPVEAADYLEGSLVRLRELSEILASYEKEIDWSQGDHAFNAVQLVQEKLVAMKSQRKP